MIMRVMEVPKKKLKHAFSFSNKLYVLLIIIVLTIIVSAGLYYFNALSNNYKKMANEIIMVDEEDNVVNVEEEAEQPRKMLSTTSPFSENYLKRQFDISKKFISTQNYPEELLNIPKIDLASMRCTKSYSWNGKDSYIYYDQSMDAEIKLANLQLLQFIKGAEATLKNNKKINAVLLCETEDGRTILEYGVHEGGGGSENVSYFGLVNSNGGVRKIVDIPTDGAPYFSCGIPLQLTRSNILYWECGGYDSFLLAKSIYVIDLNTRTSKALIKCTSLGSESGKETVNCK